MTEQHGKTTVETAFGNPKFTEQYPKGLEVTFDWKSYDTIEEVQKEWAEKDIVELCSTANKNNARSAAIASATKAFKPDPNDPAVVRKTLIAGIMKAKKVDETSAAAIVDAMLGATV